jgi:hypothetical protein
MYLNQLLLRLFFIIFCLLGSLSCTEEDTSNVDSIDVTDNGDTLFSSIAFSEVSDYNTVNDESHEFEVTKSNSFTLFGTITRTLKISEDYTLFVFGDGDNSTLNLVQDDNESPGSGRSKLRFVQASTSENGVDVYITQPDELLINTTPSFDNVRFKNISGYVESEGGNYRVRVTKRDSLVVLVDSGIINLESGSVYTLILVDPTTFVGRPDLVLVTDKE